MQSTALEVLAGDWARLATSTRPSSRTWEGDSEYPAAVGPFEPVVIAEANDAPEHRQRAACLNSLTRLFRVADGLAQARPLIRCVFAL